MLKAYFDAGNKADSHTYKTLTLAGYAATDSIWLRVEKQWNEALALYGTNYMHMAEAITLNGAYSRANGWDEARVRDLIQCLIKVMRSFRGVPICGISCTVILSDYLAAWEKVPNLPPVENICTTQCMGAALELHGYSAGRCLPKTGFAARQFIFKCRTEASRGCELAKQNQLKSLGVKQ